MPSPADHGAKRLLGLKEAQMRIARSGALAQARHAREQRDEALQLRQQAEQTLQAALPKPEQGLSRSALYDRLRALAVARAHALEVEQAAIELDGRAAACDAREQALQRQALQHQRKKSKLEHWHQLRSREQARVRQQRQQQNQTEDLTCRRRLPR